MQKYKIEYSDFLWGKGRSLSEICEYDHKINGKEIKAVNVGKFFAKKRDCRPSELW